ncbi:MAG: hypothetical protein UW81_C0019G0001 [Candidatus Giovannonibacteria bacterium GW2011_GWC2_44_9]|uniref:Uncharacterized protein n=3 Tax=Candidatus Giovannoniibacteriota TaxID=1752738 RepID=A0A0G1LT24_9BACT|nr:MAG: hypothetical protein UW49_C0017G0001 [Candidatus Giovannonibacteria bacterium GW2011_GWB1_44_23]KKT62889.1 MAG: hypothetical protein UW57_C0012G0001 [Candidatus Giovannonibacteria bacterium GW2011_GWA1_44_29]KKT83394.1 MAG: hypothetical protein UW81_C0019G0001 [Candidatus Giovannonibacteria bacterium GW2011_GWC2_44_9]KKT91083.1 MAG: hypothetical protein UW93_C0013G0001 [Parcubacteria group bacterium GW2011_GWC1_45_13]
MPKIIKKGASMDKPWWKKWMGVNGTKESAPLCCPFCKTIFALIRGDHVLVRADCYSENVVVKYFIQCPNCRHRANHDLAVVESNAA